MIFTMLKGYENIAHIFVSKLRDQKYIEVMLVKGQNRFDVRKYSFSQRNTTECS